MSTTDTGSQELFYKYKFPLNANILTNRFQGIADVGVYEGMSLTKESTTSTRVETGAIEIGDGTYQTKIRFQSSFVLLTSDTSKPYIVVRWSYQESETDIYAEILTVAYADIQSTDVVLGKVLYNTSNEVDSFDYSLTTYPVRHYAETAQSAGKVYATQPESGGVHVNTARVKTHNGYVSITAGDYTVPTAPSTNPRYDLVYVDASGDVQFESGTEAVSPDIPDFKNRLVLAYIYRAVGVTEVYDEDINWVSYDKQANEGDYFVRGDSDIEGSETVNSGQSGGVFNAKGDTDGDLIKTFPTTDQVGLGASSVTAGYKAETGGDHNVNGKMNSTTMRLEDQADTNMSYTSDPVNETFGSPTGGVKVDGYVSAYRTTNPYYMDIAETLPVNPEFSKDAEPGILLYYNDKGYIDFDGKFYAGVYSETYGHLLGKLPKDKSRIPVALKGSVLVCIDELYRGVIKAGSLLIAGGNGVGLCKSMAVPVSRRRYVKSVNKVGRVISKDRDFIYNLFSRESVGDLIVEDCFKVLVWLD